MNKIIISIILAFSLLFFVPTTILASGDQVCTTMYGGAVQCNETPPSKTVNAGLEDFSPVTVGIVFIVIAGALGAFANSKRVRV